MISQKMIDWGAQGCAIREIAAYGDRRAAEIGAENVFNFTIGSPSVEPPESVAETIRTLLSELPPQELHAYTPAPGLLEVRSRIAEYLNRSFGATYRPEDIFMTSGASSALAISCAALLSEGDELLTIAPCFSEYKIYAEAAGAKFVVVPSDMETFRVDLAAMERALSERTAAVLLNSPNNPSGAVFSRESLTETARLLERKSGEYGHPIYLIADEPYRELVYGQREVSFLPAIYSDTVYCYSFSKSLSLPGERVGFLAVSPQAAEHDAVMAAINGAARALGYINVSSLFQRVVGACIGQTADLAVYEENRNYIYSALTELGYSCVRPDGAFYLFIRTPGEPGAFCSQAMSMDLLLIPGEEFYCPGYARLAYCVPKEKLERSVPVFRTLAQRFGLCR